MTIVVIHHSSPQGDAALSAGQDLSRERNEPLLILDARSGSNAPGTDDLEHRAFTQQVQKALDAGTTWKAELVEPGEDPPEAIMERIREVQPSVVVLGTRHRSAIGKMFLGHTVHRYLLEIDSPILLVKPQHK
jgi:nucleotide-binding universal stress UspA family protein